MFLVRFFQQLCVEKVGTRQSPSNANELCDAAPEESRVKYVPGFRIIEVPNSISRCVIKANPHMSKTAAVKTYFTSQGLLKKKHNFPVVSHLIPPTTEHPTLIVFE